MCYSTLMSQLTTLIQAFTLCAGGFRSSQCGGMRGWMGASPAAMAQLVRSSAHNAKAIDKLSTDMSSLKENLARIEGLLVGSEARSKRPPGQNLSA